MYLLTSFVFVLCTLIEYVLVLNCENIIINRRKKKKHAKKEVSNFPIKLDIPIIVTFQIFLFMEGETKFCIKAAEQLLETLLQEKVMLHE